jgi:cytoskeletal protein CcmA (bactofilin family)
MKKILISAAFAMVIVVLLTSFGYAVQIDIRKGGSFWASVGDNGDIRINGSIVGQIECSDGAVRKNGSIVGIVENQGTIRKNGSIYGQIEQDGNLRINGSIVGKVEDGGTIRKNGSIWGSVPSAQKYITKRKVAAVLIFFSDDF